MNGIEFFCPGIPVPGGSKRAFIMHRRGCPAGRRNNPGPCVCKPFTQVTDSAGQRNKDWRSAVVTFAYEATRDWACEQTPTQQKAILPLFSGPISFSCTFWMPRPKNHYGKGGFILPSAPDYPITRPDVLKLARAVEDALTGIMWTDDSIIVSEQLRKEYCYDDHAPGVMIAVGSMPEFGQEELSLARANHERTVRKYTLRDPRR